MKLRKKKKAFTLTELLVVVVVIGVLSAVVLPKFSKVIETRRTTEAEELMGAVRTEQEKRCALDKRYLMEFSGLSDIVKTDETKNYKLTLASTGISANRKDNYSYTLEMPSYADGRICCNGDDCEKLNKNYPSCDDLSQRTADYQVSPASCAGIVDACEQDPTSCECNPNQAKCCPEGTVWLGHFCGTVSITDPIPSTPVQPDPPVIVMECTEGAVRGEEKCNICGSRATEKCVNGKWTAYTGECNKQKKDCDCCADGLTDAEFSQCIQAHSSEYPVGSAEYACAFGSLTLGGKELTGAVACLWALGLGSDTNGVTPTSWVSGGFKRYACTQEKPTVSKPNSNSSSDSSCTWQKYSSRSTRDAMVECDIPTSNRANTARINAQRRVEAEGMACNNIYEGSKQNGNHGATCLVLNTASASCSSGSSCCAASHWTVSFDTLICK